MFSGPVHHVAKTNIFVSELGDNHCTVYEMQVAARVPVAMILPVPVIACGGEDALSFINLEKFPNFFKAMAETFPARASKGMRGRGRDRGLLGSAPLKVHDVGQYIASYVPSVDQFDRLDERFRMPQNVWDSLPDYQDFGFAVFQLKETGLEPRNFHPMAYRYPPADPYRLFFPTIHVHDLEVPKNAAYDHYLYYQPGGYFKSMFESQRETRAMLGSSFEPNDLGLWESADQYSFARFPFESSEGLVDKTRPLERLKVVGKLPNEDYALRSQIQSATSLHKSKVRT
jgi:hypothetical protein